MTTRHGTLPHLIFVCACTAIVAALQLVRFTPLIRVEMAIQDAIMRAGRTAVRDPSLVFLARDTASANLETENDLERLLAIHEADPEAQRALTLMGMPWRRMNLPSAGLAVNTVNGIASTYPAVSGRLQMSTLGEIR